MHYSKGYDVNVGRRTPTGSLLSNSFFAVIAANVVVVCWLMAEGYDFPEGIISFLYAIYRDNFTVICVILFLDLVLLLTVASPFGTIYIVDYVTCKPDKRFEVSSDIFLKQSRDSGYFSEESINFQQRLLKTSGLSEHTYFPEGILSTPPIQTMQMARKEAEYVFQKTLDELFATNQVRPKDIDFLIVNCSLFCPTPSLSSMIVNLYKMREDIKTYNLGGMGCSASPISVDLAKMLLLQKRNSIALVLSTENITQNWYHGKERNMLISNVLFRMGGAAILLTNKPWWCRRARAELVQATRIHRGHNDEAYGAVYQDEDPEKNFGVRLSKDIVRVATGGIVRNLYHVGRQWLPISQQILYFIIQGMHKLHKGALLHKERQGAYPKWWSAASLPFELTLGSHLSSKGTPGWLEFYPDFQKTFKFFCIHSAGKTIIQQIKDSMKLSDQSIEPSFATLYNFGNVSSASIWYELDYIERVMKARVNGGDLVLMLAFGSGLKANSLVVRIL